MRTSAGTYSRAVVITALAAAILMLVFACATPRRAVTRGRYIGRAVVSWYGPGFHGKLTASGERYNMNALTCAHKKMPFGTRLKLVNIENGKEVTVTVNDRGPFVRGRDIDLSKAAAERLDIIGPGTGKVKVYYLNRDMRYARYIKGGSIVSPENKPHIGSYTIQVAAFGEKENAHYYKDGLELNHRQVYIIEKWVNGKRYFRVRVGKFRTHAQAQRYAQLLADEGYQVTVAPYERPN